jgi:hypothetical protein
MTNLFLHLLLYSVIIFVTQHQDKVTKTICILPVPIFRIKKSGKKEGHYISK